MENVLKYPKISGPGLTSASVKYPTHVLVKLNDYIERQLLLQLNVTSQLELVPKATPTNQTTTTSLPVVMMSPSRYKVSYTAVSRGQLILHVQVNNREINGSPCRVTVYPDPRQLDHPVRTVTGLSWPHGIAFNNYEQMIVGENHKVSIFDIKGKEKRTFGSFGDRPYQMIYPKGVATDDADNIYLSSSHKLQKFTSNGELIKCIGHIGRKEGEFHFPHGITVYNNLLLYVCDTYNHRIQVFDLDLNFVQSIGSHGSGRGQFDEPYDVKFDTAGNKYVADHYNRRVQVLDNNGIWRSFGQDRGEGKLSGPFGLLITDKIYVTDYGCNCTMVYENQPPEQFITSFKGKNARRPISICSSVDGFIYVTSFDNGEIHGF